MTEAVVIGGGAAGIMAALYAAKNGAQVTLFEKNEKLGKKIQELENTEIVGIVRETGMTVEEFRELLESLKEPKYIHSIKEETDYAEK